MLPVDGSSCQDLSHHYPTIPIQQQHCQHPRPDATTHRPAHTHAGPFTRTLTREVVAWARRVDAWAHLCAR